MNGGLFLSVHVLLKKGAKSDEQASANTLLLLLHAASFPAGLRASVSLVIILLSTPLCNDLFIALTMHPFSNLCASNVFLDRLLNVSLLKPLAL
ncbi:hypothetical protein E2C01_067413 [Portunus trituberculatus]|uniref:Uncharacterized protein n=1 Tax=Portunus trituberculatus TaxID=210409 RepID=A0A5B7HTJ4_PORTR|nr:hypothetical protein [Portunus trituberculatus]